VIDQVVSQYIEKVKSDVLNDQMQDIPHAYLMQKELPKSVKHYFDQEVENWIIEEEAKFESSDRFDYDMPEVRVKIDQIFDHLKNSATFDLNKFNQLLERAVKLEKDFTVRPQQTMANFLFKDKSTIRTKEVNDTLRYFFVYTYYKEKLTEYFNLKYLQEINIEQFKVLVKEIDDKMFAANMVDESLKMIRVIADFINIGSSNTDIIPLELIISAFKDRGITAFAELFEKVEADGKTELSFTEIEELIRNGISTEEAESPVEDVKVDDIDISSVPAPAVVEEEIDEDDDDDDDDEDEEDIVPAPEAAPTPEPVVETPASAASDKPFVRETVVNEAAANQLANMVGGPKNKGVPLQDLNELIDKKWRKKYIKKLFSKDEAGFVNFISTLNEFSVWKDASLYIEDVFYERDINPYSKEAISFSDMAYNRFFPKDGYVG
jgi:hypothetical protein